jgi:hypothetical protein
MAGEADQILRVANELIVNNSKSDSETESDVPASSSSSNVPARKMSDKTTPEIADY